MKENMISVIVPTFNEKDNIIRLIDSIHQELEGFKHQIVVVDDHSPLTLGLLRPSVGQRHPFVKAVLRTTDRGLAKSIRARAWRRRTGIFSSSWTSDFNHQPMYIRRMVMNLEFL